ncbi:hypothetical protein BROUX41_000812 [Berkeleyomyces rouxiae]|uniref:uncharacterized protein n=1 Tax=Berkeleyomyces rouxiae TaxID=2035830 RepID=UPI003B7B9AC3
MVQYIFTPWRDAAELEQVKRAFYPEACGPGPNPDSVSPATSTTDDSSLGRRRGAVDRVAMWMQRGNCPHMIESTALLTAAIIADEAQQPSTPGGLARPVSGLSDYAMRAAYSTAFSRFVTGLLDGQQDKLRKMSMFSLAKNIGLPATFVELRHQATHEPLPSLARLRSAARKAMSWIWDYYWVHLPAAGAPQPEANGTAAAPQSKPLPDGAAAEAARFLATREATDAGAREYQAKTWAAQWGVRTAARVVDAVNEEAAERQVMLRAMQMARVLAQLVDEAPVEEEHGDAEAGEAGGEQPEGEMVADVADGEPEGDGSGWAVYAGKWKPKPIGVV